MYDVLDKVMTYRVVDHHYCEADGESPRIVHSGLSRVDAQTIAAEMQEGQPPLEDFEAPRYTVEADRPQFYTVVVVKVDRAWGGPEEGGWTYDTADPLETYAQWLSHAAGYPKIFHDRDDARKAVGELECWLLDNRVNEGRRPLHSVLSDGNYQARLFVGYPTPFPATRPYYE